MAEGAIGVGLDVGNLSVGALLDLKASIDDLAKVTHSLLDAEVAYQQLGPIYVPLGANGVSGSSGNLLLDLGGPSYGRRWEVRQLITGGLLFSSSVAGSAEVYQSSVSSGGNEPSLSNIEDQAATLPRVAFYSSGQILVRHPNHLYILVVTPSATTAYTVGGVAFDSPDKPLRGMYSE